MNKVEFSIPTSALNKDPGHASVYEPVVCIMCVKIRDTPMCMNPVYVLYVCEN